MDKHNVAKRSFAASTMTSKALTVGLGMAYAVHAGALSLGSPQTFSTNAFNGPTWVITADINGDGKPDVITANNTDNNQRDVSVLLNTTSPGSGTASFAPWQAFYAVLNSNCVAAADINGDGKPDLVVAHYNLSGSSGVSVLLNTTSAGASTAAFAAESFFSTGSGSERAIAVAVADFDGDGKMDAVTANYGVGKISLFINTTATGAAAATMATHVDFASGTGVNTTHPDAIATADINGDGKPDVITANGGENTVSVFLNTTSPQFGAQHPFAAGPSPIAVVTGDINGDGKPDLVVLNNGDDTVSILLNTTPTNATTPTFASQVTFQSGSTANSSYGLILGDLDGDGKPDVIVTNQKDFKVVVLLNTTPTGATTPSLAARQGFFLGNNTNPQQPVVADLDGDGRLDLIVGLFSATQISVLMNTTPSDLIFKNGFE